MGTSCVVSKLWLCDYEFPFNSKIISDNYSPPFSKYSIKNSTPIITDL